MGAAGSPHRNTAELRGGSATATDEYLSILVRGMLIALSGTRIPG